MKFAGLCCAASQPTRANNPFRLPNLQLFQFTTSRRGCLIHRTSCIIFQSSPPPLLQLCSSSVPPPHRASRSLLPGKALSLPRRCTSPPASSSPGGLFACHAPAAELSGSPVHPLHPAACARVAVAHLEIRAAEIAQRSWLRRKVS